MTKTGVRLQSFRDANTWRRIGLILPYFLLAVIFIVVPLISIIVQSFMPTSSGPMSLNWSYIDGFIWQKILMSFIIALITTVITIILAYPFAYFLCFSINSKAAKALLVLLVTAPIWMSLLVKIIGLKTLFDCINGYQNSTYGNIFTVMGLVFKVVVPYTKGALASGITLVFLPALTTVAVPQYMNASASGTMIGDIIMQEGTLAQTSDLSLARASTLSLIICLVMVAAAAIYFITKKVISVVKTKKGGHR